MAARLPSGEVQMTGSSSATGDFPPPTVKKVTGESQASETVAHSPVADPAESQVLQTAAEIGGSRTENLSGSSTEEDYVDAAGTQALPTAGGSTLENLSGSSTEEDYVDAVGTQAFQTSGGSTVEISCTASSY